MSRWYRAYEGTVTDAKLGEVALIAGCSRSVAIAAWHCILESAAAANDSGKFDVTARRIAVILGEPVATIEGVIGGFVELGMVEGGTITAWSKRQYESDSSTERSRKHRERQRNIDATLQGRCATPPETETETERTSLLNGRANELYDALGDHANQRANGRFIALSEPINWLASGCDLDADVIPTVRAMATRATRPITTWGYFTAAVIEARDRRLAPAPPVQARAAAPPGRRPARESAMAILREAEPDATRRQIPRSYRADA